MSNAQPTDNTPDAPAADAPVTARRAPRKPWVARYLTWPTLLCLGVVIYLLFVGENSVNRRIVYEQQIDSLTRCVAELEDSLRFYHDLNRRLSTDPTLMEQVVREQYNMKRPNEDVFVVERQNKKK